MSKKLPKQVIIFLKKDEGNSFLYTLTDSSLLPLSPGEKMEVGIYELIETKTATCGIALI